MSAMLRVLLLPYGLARKLWSLSKEGARDVHNQIRFKGARIDRGCCIDSNSKIEPNSHIFINTIINNSTISSYSYIGRNSMVQNATVGKFCSIAKEVNIGLGSHPLDMFSTSQLFYRSDNAFKMNLVKKNIGFIEYKPIQIGHDVWIGTRAIIMDGVSIGHGSVIAANSVVTKDVPPYAIVGGVPARIIRYRFTEDVIESMLNLEWWQWNIEKIAKEMPGTLKILVK
jgi:phosphonate metabolism protein (transferase hexapeptide repeat family)